MLPCQSTECVHRAYTFKRFLLNIPRQIVGLALIERQGLLIFSLNPQSFLADNKRQFINFIKQALLSPRHESSDFCQTITSSSIAKITSSIAGFHMTSLKFKLQNY